MLTILAIDDSRTIREMLRETLRNAGFDVHVAVDGLDGLEKLHEVAPDVIITDINMPRMDGFEVATQVRDNGRLQHLPIIMITSRTGEKHRERALEIGVNDYMGKPFQENQLLDKIQSLLDEKVHLTYHG